MNMWKTYEEINNTTEKVYIPLAFSATIMQKKRICKTIKISRNVAVNYA